MFLILCMTKIQKYLSLKYQLISTAEVIIWIGCDFCNSFWRTLRTNRIQYLMQRIPWLNYNSEEIRYRGKGKMKSPMLVRSMDFWLAMFKPIGADDQID